MLSQRFTEFKGQQEVSKESCPHISGPLDLELAGERKMHEGNARGFRRPDSSPCSAADSVWTKDAIPLGRSSPLTEGPVQIFQFCGLN